MMQRVGETNQYYHQTQWCDYTAPMLRETGYDGHNQRDYGDSRGRHQDWASGGGADNFRRSQAAI